MDFLMQTYLEFKTSVLPYKFIYLYESGERIELVFREQDIIHQLGIDRLNKYRIMKQKGENGVSSIALKQLKSGKITMDSIYKDSEKAIILNKVSEYRFVTALLGDTKTEHYRFDCKKVPCNILASYMLYDNQKNTHFHFGSIANKDDTVSPMTWFIENDRSSKYTNNQERLHLKQILIIKK